MDILLREAHLTQDLAPLVACIRPGDIYLFFGEMGAGKTTIIREIVRQLGYADAHSPTFALIHAYPSKPPVFHMDLYRLTHPDALNSLDLDRYFDDLEAVVFVEWPERLGDWVPERAKHVSVSLVSSDERRLTLS